MEPLTDSFLSTRFYCEQAWVGFDENSFRWNRPARSGMRVPAAVRLSLQFKAEMRTSSLSCRSGI